MRVKVTVGPGGPGAAQPPRFFLQKLAWPCYEGAQFRGERLRMVEVPQVLRAPILRQSTGGTAFTIGFP